MGFGVEEILGEVGTIVLSTMKKNYRMGMILRRVHDRRCRTWNVVVVVCEVGGCGVRHGGIERFEQCWVG